MSKRYLSVLAVSVLLGASLLGALVLGSCDSFFSKSWGTPREYDPSKITITAGNLDDWVEQARKDPKLAEAVLKKIKEKVDSTAGAEKALFQDAGVSMAVESAGIGNSIMSHLQDGLDFAGKGGDERKDALISFFDKLKTENGNKCDKAAQSIAEIIVPTGDPPQFSEEFKAKAKENPSTALQAMTVLSLAALGDITLEDIQNGGIETLNGVSRDANSHIMVDSPPASAVTKVLAAYLNLVADDGFAGNDIFGGIRDMMLGL